MIAAGIFDATTGAALGRLEAPTWDILAANASAERVVLQVDPALDVETMRLDPVTLELVPLLPVSVSLVSPTAPATVDLSGVPDGATVMVRNEMGDMMTLTTPEPLTLTDPGVYWLTASTPVAYADLDAALEVTDG